MPQIRYTQCKSCGKSIVFLKTKAGKAIPIDADTYQTGQELFDPAAHVSHFATCPQAAQWRKAKAGRNEA